MNFLALAVSSVLGSVLALWATSHLARALGVEGFGAFNLARTLVDYALIPAAFGITVTASKAIARSTDGDPQLAGRVVVIRVAAAGLGAAILGLVAWLWIGDELTLAALSAMVWAVPLTALSVDWLYSAHEDQRWAGVARTAGRGLYTVIIVLAVSSASDIRLAGAALAAEAAFTTLLMWWHARRWVDLSRKVVTDVRGMVAHVKSSVHVGTAGLAVRLKTSADLIVLGALGTQAALGYYSAGYRLVMFVNSLAGLYATVLLPRMSRAAADGDSHAVVGVSTRVTTLLGAAVSVGGAAVAREAVLTLMGPAYEPAVTVATVLMVASGFIVVSLSLGYTAVALGFERLYGIITMGSAIANIGINIVLVPRFGMYAPAGTTLATEVFVAGVLVWLLRREGISAVYRGGWIVRAGTSVALMYASVRLVLGFDGGLWMAVAVGALVFAASVPLLRVLGRDDWRVLGSAVSAG